MFVRMFRLCFGAAAWFVFVVLVVLWCDPGITAKVPVWRVAALSLAGLGVASLVRWVTALAAEAWITRRAAPSARVAEVIDERGDVVGYTRNLPPDWDGTPQESKFPQAAR